MAFGMGDMGVGLSMRDQCFKHGSQPCCLFLATPATSASFSDRTMPSPGAQEEKEEGELLRTRADCRG